MRRHIQITLDFLTGAVPFVGLVVAALTDPLKWPQSLGLMTNYRWTIGEDARQVIFLSLALVYLFAWYLRTRLRYDAKPRTDFTLDIASVFAGGQTKDVPPQYSLIVIVMVRNVGTMPSALLKWQLSMRTDGIETPLPTVMFGNEIRFVSNDGTEVRYGPEDALVEKTASPIPVGAAVFGHLGAMSRVADQMRVGPDDQLVVRCVDVLDRVHEVVHDCGGQPASDSWGPFHIPGFKSQNWNSGR